MKTLLTTLALSLINTLAAFGLTLTVTNHDDSGPGSLRDEIANAAPGDTIVFDLPSPDTITLTTGELLIQNDLTITGPGADLLSVTRSSAQGTPTFLIFEISGGSVSMSGLTISNGDNTGLPYGGGVYADGYALTITNCDFVNNKGVMGGGLASGGTVDATFCSFTGNTASVGGGVYTSGPAPLTLSHCTVSSNSALYQGGGIENFQGTVQVRYSTISDNLLSTDPGSSGADGAGIYNYGDLYIDHSTIANNNNEWGNGGGIRNMISMTVTDCTFYGNIAKGDGGAIQNDTYATLIDCTITNNTASKNSTFDMDLGGGGISNYYTGGGVTLKNTIIAKNHSPIHPDIATVPSMPGYVSEGYNLIGNATDSGITSTTGDQFGTFTDPIDPMLDVLASNGGAAQTCALLPGSPALNVGDPDAPTRDQRNYDRVDAPDIGAFEFGATIPETLANISTRLLVETGDNVLIGGFIVTGTHNKPVLLRAIGPSLPVDGKLANPILELHDSTGATIATNDDWGTNANKQDIIDTGIPPTNSLESALLMTLEPGAYTAIVRGVNDSIGVALVEAYDLDRTTDAKLANISTRGLVQAGDNVMIGGLIVLGTLDENVLIRAIGPSLPVPGSLADPLLELHNADGTILATNDNWRDTQEAEILATGIPPTDNAESAIIEALAPGNYTAIVRGVGDTTGVALVEAYGLD